MRIFAKSGTAHSALFLVNVSFMLLGKSSDSDSFSIGRQSFIYFMKEFRLASLYNHLLVRYSGQAQKERNKENNIVLY